MDTYISFRYITRSQTKYESIAMALSEIHRKVNNTIANEIISHLIACEYSKNSQMIAMAFISKEGQLEDILRISDATAFSTMEKTFLEYASMKPASKNEVSKTTKGLFQDHHCLNGHNIT